MTGVLIIDKPAGMTSFDVVRQVRRWCGTRRVGHAGTLDPLATGVLPVAVGQATRLVEYLMAGEKSYRATMRLGSATDTQDATGQVLESLPWEHVDRAALDAALPRFIGEVMQLPPMYSALKKDGQPLYKLARKGVEVDRERRYIQIDSLVIDTFAPPDVTFTVRCGKGTYVRTLCHDLGRELGTAAHMTALRRVACGGFGEAVSHSLQALQERIDRGLPLPLLSPAEALADWPALSVSGAALDRLRDGVAPSMTEVDASGLVGGDLLRFLAGDTLLAVARFAPGGFGKRPGDFEIIKVFPAGADEG